MLRLPHLYLTVAAIALGVALGTAALDLVVSHEIDRMEAATVYAPRFTLDTDPGRAEEEVSSTCSGDKL